MSLCIEHVSLLPEELVGPLRSEDDGHQPFDEPRSRLVARMHSIASTEDNATDRSQMPAFEF